MEICFTIKPDIDEILDINPFMSKDRASTTIAILLLESETMDNLDLAHF